MPRRRIGFDEHSFEERRATRAPFRARVCRCLSVLALSARSARRVAVDLPVLVTVTIRSSPIPLTEIALALMSHGM